MTSRSRLTTIDSNDHHDNYHENHHEIEEDEIEEIVDLFPIRIFDASSSGEPVPPGFDAVRIKLDGTVKAELSWKLEREAASAYIAQGLRIFWEIDLGLPASLHHALGNRTQFLSLTLSLEHFCNSLWKEFRKETVGLGLYRGSMDFSQDYPWDDEQVLNLQEWLKDQYSTLDAFVDETHLTISDFSLSTIDSMTQSPVGSKLIKCFCRDAVGEYLSLLASRVPDSLPLFLLFDSTQIHDPLLMAQLLTKERYPRFYIAVKSMISCMQVLGGEIGWNGTFMEKGMITCEKINQAQIERAKLGFCLPRMTLSRPAMLASLNQAIDTLIKRTIPFRVIPEVNLATEWDGLDYLIVDTQHVEIQFKRKLQGFCAAGGTVVTIGQSLGFAHEVSIETFLKEKDVARPSRPDES
ncbi:MAG TPA: hypothetical protein VGP47_08495, partial [Parachlamydiaceae bacterium]|nr:hypothetical protein [Parachlamydiaceae bacterium]